MKSQKDKNRIGCDIFQKQFRLLNYIKPKINRARRIIDKVKYAEDILGELDPLINCSHFDEHSSDCTNCKIVAGLHKRTADLIINAKSLA